MYFICLADLFDLVQFRAIGSFLCRIGGACEGLNAWKGEEDDPSLVFLAACKASVISAHEGTQVLKLTLKLIPNSSVLQDLTVHLENPEPSIRLAVQEDLWLIDARLLPTLVSVVQEYVPSKRLSKFFGTKCL